MKEYKFAKQSDMFTKVWWRFHKFNHAEYDITCLFVLDTPPPSLFGLYFI